MKQFICLALVLVICLAFLCSCANIDKQQLKNEEERFIQISYQNNPSAYIFVDKETKVQYIRIWDGGITPLVDENGNPLLYEGELE